MKPPFFIVGTQRSGTTLLYQMLNTHPDLYVVNEFWDLYPFVTGENRDLEELSRILVSHLRLPGPYLESPDSSPREVFDHVELAFATKLREVGKSRWGIKHPRLTYYLDRFRDRYPQARFVFIVRDARGVTSSYLKRKVNVANVFHGAKLWREQIEIQESFGQRFPGSSHFLKFEDLLTDPRGELQKICAFLQEEYTEQLMSYHARTPETAVHDGNINITKPVNQAIAEKWRQKLSSRQVAIIDTVAGETMRRWGYEPASRPVEITALHRLLYGIHQRVMTTYWWQKRSRWSGLRRPLGRLAQSR